MMLYVFYSLWCLHVILEVLPISSSGHLFLLYGKKYIPEYVEYCFHIPTAVIISIFLWRYRTMLIGTGTLKELYIAGAFIVLADIVTAGFYVLLRQQKRAFPLWLGFFVTMLSLFLVRYISYGTVQVLTWKVAFLIGLGQGIALLPGISRLATTVVIGSLYGLTPLLSYLFSLAIQLPLIGAAVLKVLYKDGLSLFKRYGSIPGILAVLLCSYAAYKLLELILFLFELQATTFLGWYMLLPLSYSFYKGTK